MAHRLGHAPQPGALVNLLREAQHAVNVLAELGPEWPQQLRVLGLAPLKRGTDQNRQQVQLILEIREPPVSATTSGRVILG